MDLCRFTVAFWAAGEFIASALRVVSEQNSKAMLCSSALYDEYAM